MQEGKERGGFVFGSLISGEGLQSAAGDLVARKKLNPCDAGLVVVAEFPLEGGKVVTEGVKLDIVGPHGVRARRQWAETEDATLASVAVAELDGDVKGSTVGREEAKEFASLLFFVPEVGASEHHVNNDMLDATHKESKANMFMLEPGGQVGEGVLKEGAT